MHHSRIAIGAMLPAALALPFPFGSNTNNIGGTIVSPPPADSFAAGFLAGLKFADLPTRTTWPTTNPGTIIPLGNPVSIPVAPVVTPEVHYPALPVSPPSNNYGVEQDHGIKLYGDEYNAQVHRRGDHAVTPVSYPVKDEYKPAYPIKHDDYIPVVPLPKVDYQVEPTPVILPVEPPKVDYPSVPIPIVPEFKTPYLAEPNLVVPIPKVDYPVPVVAVDPEPKNDYHVDAKADYPIEPKKDYDVEPKVDYPTEHKVDYPVEHKDDYQTTPTEVVPVVVATPDPVPAPIPPVDIVAPILAPADLGLLNGGIVPPVPVVAAIANPATT